MFRDVSTLGYIQDTPTVGGDAHIYIGGVS